MSLVIPHGFETNYAAGFARGLAANGVEFTVISDDLLAGRLASAGLKQRNLRGSLDPRRSKWQKLTGLLRYYAWLLWTVFRHRGETIHFNGLLQSRLILVEGLIFPLWFRLWAGCYIHTAHNALPHGREKSRLFQIAYRYIYRFPHVIIAHTAKVADQLETEFGVRQDRIRVISIGLNEEVPFCEQSTEAARAKLGLPRDGAVALFFGKVEPYKGVDVLAEAWGHVRAPDARLIVAGWSPDAGYTRTVREAIAKSPRAATMEWREGFVPNEEVALWLRACDCVVMPYRHIYQSGVIFLCLRFGVPIVATNVGSLAEFVDADSGVLARENSPAGIAAALDEFFANKARFRREMIARNSTKYAWDRQCAAITHLYD